VPPPSAHTHNRLPHAFQLCQQNLHCATESVSSVENVGQKTIDEKSKVAFKEKRKAFIWTFAFLSLG
jgi:hypothetical protein